MNGSAPIRLVVLTSHAAPGLAQLVTHPDRGALFDIAAVIGSEAELRELPLLEEAHVPVEMRPMRAHASFRNLVSREDYDDELAELVVRMNPTHIFVTGYRYILTQRFLSAFEGKVIGLHDADLSLRESRLYAGPHAVRDAILAGEPETRMSAYLLTNDVARGPLFLLSGAYPLAPMARAARERGDADSLTRYAELHREWMLADAGTMLMRVIELLAGGTVRTIGDTVWVDGAPGPCRLGEAPRACHEPESMVARGIPRSCPFIG